ncbi:MAG: hypothetical protein IPN34_00750 [Planctomycetes bacterium]|nr:hypothetical protein [Planctomycetota bacterium]
MKGIVRGHFVALGCALVAASCAKLEVGPFEPGAEHLPRFLFERVARGRGLPEAEPPLVLLRDEEELRAALERAVDQRLQGESLHARLHALQAFGMAPPGFDLRKALLDIYAADLGAFYDPGTGEVLVLADALRTDRELPSLARALHAAMLDERTDLEGYELRAESSSADGRSAAQSLIQGSAEASLDELRAHESFTDTLINLGESMRAGAHARRLADTEIVSRSLPPETQQTLEGVSPGLRAMLLFPQMQGLAFVRALRERYGWSAVDHALTDPPLSSEQILHPEKYHAQRDDPTAVALFPAELLPEWKPVAEDSFGELGVRAFLSTFRPRARAYDAAAGWGGDRYRVVEGPAGQIALLWHTEWDREEDAAEFGREVSAALVAKSELVASGWRKIPRVEPPEDPSYEWLSADQQRYLLVRTEGRRVLVVEGFTPEEARALAERMAREDQVELAAAHAVHETSFGDILLFVPRLVLDVSREELDLRVDLLMGLLFSTQSHIGGWNFDLLKGGLYSMESSEERFRVALLFGLFAVHSMPRAENFSLHLLPLLEHGASPEGSTWWFLLGLLGWSDGPGSHELRTALYNCDEVRELGFDAEGRPVPGELVAEGESFVLGMLSRRRELGEAGSSGSWEQRRLALVLGLLFGLESRTITTEPEPYFASFEGHQWGLLLSILASGSSFEPRVGEARGAAQTDFRMLLGLLWRSTYDGGNGEWATLLPGWRCDARGRYATLFFGLLPIRVGEGEPRPAPPVRPRGFVRFEGD